VDAVRHPRRRIGRHLRSGVRRDGRGAHRLAVAALIAAAIGGADPDGAAGAQIVAYPGPGWGFASPATQITFSGAQPSTLGAVRVRGSRSGPHAGSLRAIPGRSVTVFTPRRGFRSGERVTVRTDAAVRGADGPAFSFTVARFAHPRFLHADLGGLRGLPRLPPRPRLGLGDCRPRRRRFVTLPDLRPDAFCVNRRPARRAAPGYVLLTQRSHPERRPIEQHGVMIVSSRGHLLWYAARPDVARDIKTVTYRGERMLAFYQSAGGSSYYVLLDDHYREVIRIRAGNGYRTNTHELQISRRGTAWVSAYQSVRLRSGRVVTDNVLQEIDPASSAVLFEWHALDHVPPSASYQPRPARRFSWDYFHANSIDPPRGSEAIVVSARNTSAVYGIDPATGAVRWTLGGKRDDFRFVRRHPGEQFCAQHDARRLPGGHIMLFDNGGPALGTMRDCPAHRARVQELALRFGPRRARVARTIPSARSSPDGAGLWVWAMGSAQRLRGGNVLVDWGTTGRVTEVDRRGHVVFGLRLRSYSYRAARSEWHGHPPGRPLIQARRQGRRTVRVWASWNGATEVRRWQVLAGSSPVGRPHRFRGLETSMRVATTARRVAVSALDGRGRTIGQSRVEPVH
jgi:hypothetical protein